MEMKLPKIVVSALIKKDEKFLLVKEVLESGNEYWIVSDGTVEFGATLEDAIKSEIKDGTNLGISIVKFLDFKEFVRTKFGYHTIIFFFLAKPLNGDMHTEKKILDAKFFGKEEIKGLDLVDSARWLFERHVQ